MNFCHCRNAVVSLALVVGVVGNAHAGYVGNDPMNATDPTGTTCETVTDNKGATRATSCKIDQGRDALVRQIGEKRVASMEKQYLTAVNKLYANGGSVNVKVREIGADGKLTGGTKSADISARDVAGQLSSRTFVADMSSNRVMYTSPIENKTTIGRGIAGMWSGGSIAGLSGATTSPELRLQVAFGHEGIHGPSQGLYNMFDRQLGLKLYNRVQAEAWNDEHQDPYDRAAYDLLY